MPLTGENLAPSASIRPSSPRERTWQATACRPRALAVMVGGGVGVVRCRPGVVGEDLIHAVQLLPRRRLRAMAPVVAAFLPCLTCCGRRATLDWRVGARYGRER